jgi:nitrite reductase/ring-hydroxylating ferredoxin subunit
MAFHRVASVNDLEDGEMIQVVVGETEMLLARIGEEYFAINDECTHFHTMLHDGILHTDTYEVECPLHESMFDLRTGEPTGPPAEEPEPVHEVQVEGTDIFIAL